MTERDVRIRYTVEGTSEAHASVEQLAQAFQQQLAPATAAATGATEAYEQEIASLRAQVTELRGEVDRGATSHAAMAGAARESTQRAIEFTQRLSGAASAVQSLSAQLGVQGGAAGLIGSLTASAAAGAQLGGTFGPQGALVGGILGAAIPAITMLIQRQDDATLAATRHAEAVTTLANALEQQTTSARRAADVAAGVFGSDTSTSDLAQIQRERLAAITLLEQQRGEVASAPVRRTRTGALEGGASPERLRQIDEQIAQARRELDGVQREIERRTQPQSSGIVVPGADRRGLGLERIVTPPRSGARRPTLDDLMGGTASREDIIGLDSGPSAVEQSETVDARRSRVRRQREEREREEYAEYEASRREGELKHEDLLDEKRRENHEAQLTRMQQQTAILADTSSTIGGVFANAFESAISGQEDFDDALVKGTKTALINFGTTMVAEGAGALLTGVGNTILNPPAAATKIAEGAGKIALGVSLGAAGAAINTGGAPAAKPERPSRSGTDSRSGGDGATGGVTIMMNAPTVLGGTQAEFGRNAGRSLRAATRRYGPSA
jgi:hypothetical protein